MGDSHGRFNWCKAYHIWPWAVESAEVVALLAGAVNNSPMGVRQWNERYRSSGRANEDGEAVPNPMLAETVATLRPGKALDLAGGTGRNAIWLAEHGWSVTAIDGAAKAIEILHARAAQRGVPVTTQVADLEKGEYQIADSFWDLIVMCFYLQTSLFGAAKRGIRPGGVVLVIVHIAAPGQDPAEYELRPGELRGYFADWEILHSYEGQPRDAAHKRLVAEIVARRPDHVNTNADPSLRSQ